MLVVFAPWAKKNAHYTVWLILGHFWCSIVSSVTFSSNRSKIKIIKKSKKNSNKSEKIHYNQNSEFFF